MMRPPGSADLRRRGNGSTDVVVRMDMQAQVATDAGGNG
jgi:hypothetical protein